MAEIAPRTATLSAPVRAGAEALLKRFTAELESASQAMTRADPQEIEACAARLALHCESLQSLAGAATRHRERGQQLAQQILPILQDAALAQQRCATALNAGRHYHQQRLSALLRLANAEGEKPSGYDSRGMQTTLGPA